MGSKNIPPDVYAFDTVGGIAVCEGKEENSPVRNSTLKHIPGLDDGKVRSICYEGHRH